MLKKETNKTSVEPNVLVVVYENEDLAEKIKNKNAKIVELHRLPTQKDMNALMEFEISILYCVCSTKSRKLKYLDCIEYLISITIPKSHIDSKLTLFLKKSGVTVNFSKPQRTEQKLTRKMSAIYKEKLTQKINAICKKKITRIRLKEPVKTQTSILCRQR